MEIKNQSTSFARVEAGTFSMGAILRPDVIDTSAAQPEVGPTPGPNWDEAPVHEVRISQPYEIAKSRVTQAEFARFKPEHEAYIQSMGLTWQPSAPAVMVT